MSGVADLVQGKNCVFQVNFGDGYQTVVCAKGFSATFETELKETTSRGSGVHKEFDYKSLSYRINLTGLIKVQDNDGNVVFFDLAFYQKNFLELPFKALFTDNFGNIKTIRGVGVVASSAFNASAAQLADSSVDIQGSGEYFIDNDSALGCGNSISEIVLNGNPLNDDSNVLVPNATVNLTLTINSIANPAIEIFRYDYEIDGGGRNSAFSSGALPLDIGAIDVSGWAPGQHTLVIWPVCSNGFDGNAFTVNIGKISPD